MTLDATRSASIQDCLHAPSVLAGAEPVLLHPPSGPKASASPEGRLAAIEEVSERVYLSLVPTQLARVLERSDLAELQALASCAAVLIGGGPLLPQIRAHAEGNGIRVVQTFGMSETCGGCVYDGRPLDGVEVRIGDGGEVLLRGPVLFDGYGGEPERTERALVDGWFHTDDLGQLEPDGRLRVLGRSDDVIISGGLKVPAGVVAAMIATDVALLGVEVVGVPDEQWGERVVAVVAADNPASLDRVRDLVEPRTWAPRQLVVVEALPLLSNGKPDRVAIKELAARD